MDQYFYGPSCYSSLFYINLKYLQLINSAFVQNSILNFEQSDERIDFTIICIFTLFFIFVKDIHIGVVKIH